MSGTIKDFLRWVEIDKMEGACGRGFAALLSEFQSRFYPYQDVDWVKFRKNFMYMYTLSNRGKTWLSELNV